MAKKAKVKRTDPKKSFRTIKSVKLEAGAGSVSVIAAKTEEGEEDGPKKIEMLAYTGGVMSVGYYGPVVVDLAGMQIPKGAVPLFRDHDPERIIGHGTAQVKDGQLFVEGLASVDNELSREFVQSSESGFPWQASIGASPVRGKIDELGEGSKAKVNGQEVVGPAMIIRQSRLNEVSAVPLGADNNTVSRVAACFVNYTEEEVMDFEAYVESKGFVLAELSEEQIVTLKAAWKAEGHKEEPKEPVKASKVSIIDVSASVQDAIKAERERMADVAAACDTEGLDTEAAKKMNELQAKANKEGLSITEVQAEALQIVRAARPQPTVGLVADAADKKHNVIEAAIMKQVGGDTSDYSAEDLKASKDFRGIGLKSLCEIVAKSEGIDMPLVFSNESIKAAFTTTGLSGILSNVLGKELLRGYNMIDAVSMELAGTRTVSDFKQVKSYRTIGEGKWEEVADTGKITHGEIAEQDYTNQAKTYGEIITLGRQMIINDDLGAFSQLAFIMGRSAAITRERIFFSVLKGNANSFYHANNNNLVTSNSFAAAGMEAAVNKMALQTDDKGNPILLAGDRLLVPVALKFEAQQLIGSAQLLPVGATDATNIPTANPFQNGYRVLSSPYLDKALEGSADTTSWYLFANPMDAASYEFAFLNGVETPIIETGETDFDTLGMSWRGYHDFGLSQQDPRASVKSTA